MNTDLYFLLKHSLFGRDDSELAGKTITPELFQELRDQTVFGLPARQIGHLTMEDELRNKWKWLLCSNLQHYYQVMTVQQQITELLGSHGIRAVILKGSSAAMYYPEPQNRIMGDIDVLVKNELLEESRQLLVSNGFEQWEKSIERHYCFEKSGIHIELHHHFSDSMEKDQAEFLDTRLQKAIDQAVQHTSGKYTWYSFDVLENGLVLLQHIRQHLLIGIGLRQIIDWMMFVNAEMTDALWAEFSPLAEACGNKELAMLTTRMCELYLGLPGERKWCSSVKDELCAEMLRYIEQNGNFGRKREFYSSSTTSALRSLRKKPFSYLQRCGLIRWKAAQKYSFLRPFAWLYQIGYYIKRGLFERKSGLKNLSGEWKDAQKQSEVFDYLGICY